MKNKIKVITLSSFLLATTIGLTGCRFLGGDDTPIDSNKIQLKIGFWPTASDKKDVAMYTVWKNKFEKDNPKYQIIADPYTYSKDTIGSKHSTGTLPMVYQTWFTEPETLMKNGYIRDITSILDEFGWADKMDDGMRETLTFDNKIYGIPRDGYGLGLLINIKTLGDCDLLPEKDGKYVLYNEDNSPAYPTTFEEIYEFSQTIVDSYANTKGILICSANKNGGWQLSNMAWNYGATLETIGTDGKCTANLTDPGMVSALSWIKKMKAEGLLIKDLAVTYDQWSSHIGEKVAMAIVGSDVLQDATVQAGVDMGDLAFVPMPTGDGTHHYSLYGGTPYVFDSNTTDEQVRGILKFFDYIGRSPSTSKTNIDAIKEGYEVAKNKNQPILPKIMPWKNAEFLEVAKQLEDEYISVDMNYYSPFFDTVREYQHPEVPVAAQKMYEYLDTAIQTIFQNPEGANVNSALTTANANFQKYLNDNNL